MTGVDINEALRTYLGSDAKGGVTPYGMKERVRERYGASAAEVQAAIDLALDGLLEVPASMRFESLPAIAAFAAEQARRRNPELDAEVCRAIGSYVSYGYR
jgi:hypothetical protein